MNEEEKKVIEDINGLINIFETDNGKDFEATCLVQKEIASNLKILLSLIEKLQKENEEYSKQLDLDYVDNNYIPKQKIKDKIEQINKMIAYEHNDAVIIQLGKQKRVLQKLLESEE